MTLVNRSVLREVMVQGAPSGTILRDRNRNVGVTCMDVFKELTDVRRLPLVPPEILVVRSEFGRLITDIFLDERSAGRQTGRDGSSRGARQCSSDDKSRGSS